MLGHSDAEGYTAHSPPVCRRAVALTASLTKVRNPNGNRNVPYVKRNGTKLYRNFNNAENRWNSNDRFLRDTRSCFLTIYFVRFFFVSALFFHP